MVFENQLLSFLNSGSDKNALDSKRLTYIVLIKLGMMGLFASLFVIHAIFRMHPIHLIADAWGVMGFARAIYLLKTDREKAGADLVIWSLVGMTFLYSTGVDYFSAAPVNFLRLYVTMICVMGILILSISIFTSFNSYRSLSAIFFLTLTLQAITIVRHNGGLSGVTGEMCAYYLIAIMTSAVASLISHIISNLNRSLYEQNKLDAEIIKQQNQFLKQTVETQTFELKETNARLNDFAHIASHDLREPLRSISGFSTILKQHLHKKGVQDEESRELLEFIIAGVSRMNDLIKDILTFSVMSKGRRFDTFEDVDLQSLMQFIKADLDAALNANNAVLEYHDLPVIQGQKNLINQLLLNLISNALRHRNRLVKPLIIVSSYKKDDRVVVTVKDNGNGVPKEIQNKIFEAHYSHDPNMANESTGMGLSICKRIVQFHKGDIWVESDGQTGTTFCCSFPANPGGRHTKPANMQASLN